MRPVIRKAMRKVLKEGILMPLLVSAIVAAAGIFPSVAFAKTAAEHRDLIAVISVSNMGSKLVHPFFRAEEKKAKKRTLRAGTGNYRNIKIFYREEATLHNFLNAIRESELDPEVSEIDTVIYLHGDPREICFVDYPECISTREVSVAIQKLKGADGSGPHKLRALYSDACFGDTHAEDFLQAGFRVYAGGKGTDTNKSVDYGRFLDAWVEGHSFRSSIHWANEAWITPISDYLERGDSLKVVSGAGNISIDD